MTELKMIMMDEGINEREAAKYLVTNKLGRLKVASFGTYTIDKIGDAYAVVGNEAENDFYFEDINAGLEIINLLNKYSITTAEYIDILNYIY